MDEASQNSFYEDDVPLIHSITGVTSHQKSDGGHFTLKGTCQHLQHGEKYPSDGSDFTVPVCEEQKCQPVGLRGRNGIDNSTSLSQVPSVEGQTVPSTGLAGEKPSITQCNLEEMRDNSGIMLSPPCKRRRLHNASCEANVEGDTGKSGATQRDLYLDWNAHSHFESELVNKVPVGWPTIGVKSIVTGNKAISQITTLSFFALVERAHLLSEEQLHEIKKLEYMEHTDQSPRSRLKRSSSSYETSGSRAEKFAKIGIDVDEENSSEEHELYLQEEPNDDWSGGSYVCADQEVPIQEVNSADSSRQAVKEDSTLRVQCHGDSDNLTSKVSYFEIPTIKGINNNIGRQGSNDFRQTSSHDESNNVGSCSEPFSLKCEEKSKNLTNGCSEVPAATESNKQASCIVCPANDQPQMSSGSVEKQQTAMITNKHIVPHISCKYPLLPQKMTNETDLCSSLRTIGETHRIDEQFLNDVDWSPSQSRNELLTREASSLCKQEEVHELVNYDAFPNDVNHLQGLECMISSSPLNKPATHIELFDKVKLDECLENQVEDCSVDEQSVFLVHNTTPSSRNKDNIALENAKEHGPFSVAADSMNGHLQDAQNNCEETPNNNMQSEETTNEMVEMVSDFPGQGNDIQSEESTNEKTLEMVSDFPGQENNMQSEESTNDKTLEMVSDFPGQGTNMQSEESTNEKTLEMVSDFPGQETNSKRVLNVTTTTDDSLRASDDDKENTREFSEEYGHQRNKATGIADKNNTNNVLHEESNHFRAQIECRMLDLEGPELLQFARMFVQGALKKSKTVSGCNDPLQYDEEKSDKSRAVPAFSWKIKLAYYSQHAHLEPSDDEKSSNEPGSYSNDMNDENMNGDNIQGPHLARPLSNTSCNRPFRLGLSRKHINKPLHPYFKKQPKSEPN